MAVQLFHTVVVAAMLMPAMASTTPLSRRRAPVLTIRPITLVELGFQCAVQGWTNCQNMTRHLLDSNHDINVYIDNCLRWNNPYEPATSLPPVLYTNIDDRVSTDNANVIEAESGSGGTAIPTPSTSASPPDITARNSSNSDATAERCTVSRDEMRRIRNDIYCWQLFEIDDVLRSIIPLMCLLRDLGNCIRYTPDRGYLTVDQIMESIHLWHSDMIRTHKGCCEADSGRRFTENLNQLYGYRMIRVGEEASMPCPFYGATYAWDHGLSNVALLVHMLELMQNLGRRRTCLRGCVNERQVLCTSLLLSTL